MSHSEAAEQTMADLKREQGGDEVSQFQELMNLAARRMGLPSNLIRRVPGGPDRPEGFTFQLRHPFYTAYPLSCVYRMEVAVDGVSFPQDQICLVVRDQYIPARHAPTFHELWWGFSEVIEVFVELKNPSQQEVLRRSAVHIDVTLEARTSISYGMPNDRYTVHFIQEMEVH